MRTESLARGNELQKLIQITSMMLTRLINLRDAASKKPAVSSMYVGNDARIAKTDNLYNLYVGEWGDDCGNGAALSRYEGNDEVLDVIIATLEKQLSKFQAEFKLL